MKVLILLILLSSCGTIRQEPDERQQIKIDSLKKASENKNTPIKNY